MRQRRDGEIEIFNREFNLDNGIDFDNRVIRISGSISSSRHDEEDWSDCFTFNLLDLALNKMEKDSIDKPIIIKINSPGGDCYEALAIVGRIKSSPCTIITEGFGQVMSAATLVLMCGDIRRLSKFAICMFHEISYGVFGEHENIKEQVVQTDKEQKLWAQFYEEYSKKSSSFWLSKMKKKEYYPTPQEMIELGAVDELI
jgi:ATP-dependent protease ClpP protease subunit